MTFARNTAYAEEVVSRYGDRLGEYLETFTSDTGQVSAEFFKKKDKLVAYVTYADDVTWQSVTDKYVVALRQRAEELGFGHSFQIIYAGM
jgi:hypothetical protein